MYCAQCGARMPEGTRFCTKCGARIPVEPRGVPDACAPATADAPAMPTRVIEVPQTAAQRPQDTRPQPVVAGPAPSRRGHGAIVAAAVGAGVLAGIGIAAALTSGFGLLVPGEPAARVAVEQEVQPEDAEEPAEAQVEPSTIKLTLEDAADREAIGTFISNFTEVGQGITAQSTYERSDQPDAQTVEDMVLYLEYHMLGNANDHVEAVAADDPLAAEGYAYRVDVSYLIGRIARQFDVTVTSDQLPYTVSDGNRGTVEGDWFYFATSVEYWQSMGVPYPTSLTDLGSNRYEVTFDVYRPADGIRPVDVLLRVYGWPLADMLEAVGASDTPAYSARATVEAYLNDDGDVTFHLLSMN